MPEAIDGVDRSEEMQRLEEAVRNCTLCRLCEERNNGVPGEGDLKSVVMFVGEGPGAVEDRTGRPFVGPSGEFLTQMLRSVGLQRHEVYITNVVKCRPPGNRDPQADELAACSDYLSRQIELINPRIIVTLGRFSMERWFPGGRITRIHGSVKNIGRGRIAMAMFHPAAALRNPEWKTAFANDMARLPALIERAKAANEAALRGEKLPAGVPHPGDPDFDNDGESGSEPQSEDDLPDQLTLL